MVESPAIVKTIQISNFKQTFGFILGSSSSLGCWGENNSNTLGGQQFGEEI